MCAANTMGSYNDDPKICSKSVNFAFNFFSQAYLFVFFKVLSLPVKAVMAELPCKKVLKFLEFTSPSFADPHFKTEIRENISNDLARQDNKENPEKSHLGGKFMKKFI